MGKRSYADMVLSAFSHCKCVWIDLTLEIQEAIFALTLFDMIYDIVYIMKVYAVRISSAFLSFFCSCFFLILLTEMCFSYLYVLYLLSRERCTTSEKKLKCNIEIAKRKKKRNVYAAAIVVVVWVWWLKWYWYWITLSWDGRDDVKRKNVPSTRQM